MSDAFAEFDDGVPNVARMYDYFLGGSHNFAVDRARGDQIMAARPNTAASARANRGFLRHAVEHVLASGVDQFLDLGSGIPTAGNVHEVARQHGAAARVAYVDAEPVAVAHSAAILAETEDATITKADLRDPHAVLHAPGVAGLLDFDRPVALLLLAVLHFIPDDRDVVALLTRYREHLAPGSVLVLSHSSADYPDDPETADAMREVAALYTSTSNPVELRDRARLTELVDAAGFRSPAGGPTDIHRWASPERDQPLGAYALISLPLRRPAG